MPKLKLHKIVGRIRNQNVEFIINQTNKVSIDKSKKILRSLGGFNKAIISDIELSESKEIEVKDKKIEINYLNSFNSGIDKDGHEKEDKVDFYVHSFLFEGVSSENKKYYIERILGFYNIETKRVDISEWRAKVNARISKELIKSETNEIDITLEEIKKEVEGKEIKSLYAGTPISLISELKEEKNK